MDPAGYRRCLVASDWPRRGRGSTAEEGGGGGGEGGGRRAAGGRAGIGERRGPRSRAARAARAGKARWRWWPGRSRMLSECAAAPGSGVARALSGAGRGLVRRQEVRQRRQLPGTELWW